MTSQLISALKNPACYPHPVSTIEVIETHISWVILTGKHAYKIKKPVNFGFLDFTSLAQRKQYCEAELSLNARSAPDIYIGLVAICGAPGSPNFTGEGEIIEYAVKMNQFEAGQLFTELHEKDQLSFAHIDELAEQIATFHQRVKPATEEDSFGQPEQVYAPMQQNFEQIRERLDDPELLTQLAQLEAWTESTYERLKPLLQQRKAKGFIRECHGDMHLGNLTLYKGHVTLFDCIEFNDNFRWIDVISDIAFLVMDFEDHGLPHFANRFLDEYLEHTGDYAGLRLYSFYKAYRAVVRAKIALITIESQPHRKAELFDSYRSYIDLAENCSSLPNRFILTMHGVSGTGKSTVALRLVDKLGAIRIRSDIERKRLFHLDTHDHPDDEMAKKVYSDKANHETYEQVAEMCAHVLDSGLSAIIDATNLKRWQRETIQTLGDSRGVPVCIAYCQASMSLIKDWIQKRTREDSDVSDADLNVVKRQMDLRDALSTDEMHQTFIIHSNIIEETNELVSQIKQRFL